MSETITFERIISSRFNFPRRIYRKLFTVFVRNYSSYKINNSEQDQIFEEFGFSRIDGLTKLNKILFTSLTLEPPITIP